MTDANANTETLSVKFEVNDNRADAKAVASAMLAVTTVVDEVKRGCGENTTILQKARPFAKGSLEVCIDLIVVGVVLFQDYPFFQKLNNVIRQYFDIKDKISGGKYSVKNGDIVIVQGNEIKVDELVLNLLDPYGDVEKASSEAFKAIEEDTLIKSVKIRSSSSVEPLAYVLREKFSNFYTQCLEEQGEFISEKRYLIQAELTLRQVNFDRELVWKFIYERKKINAKITCEKFLERVEKGEEFSSGDRLKVTLEVKSGYDKKTKSYIDREYTVVTVLRHMKFNEIDDGQMTLF